MTTPDCRWSPTGRRSPRSRLAAMRTRRFGDTELVASEIAFGTWALGSDWWGETDDPDRLIGRALELGVTFFDTGDAYGQGRNEEIVGPRARTAPTATRSRSRPSSATSSTPSAASTPRASDLRTGRRSTRARRSRPACGGSAPTTSTSTSSTTRAWTRSVATTSSPSSRRCGRRASSAPTASRSARRSAGATRESPRYANEGCMPCRPSTTCSSRSRAATSWPPPRKPARGSWPGSRPRAGCSRTSTRRRPPSPATTTVATASGSG